MSETHFEADVSPVAPTTSSWSDVVIPRVRLRATVRTGQRLRLPVLPTTSIRGALLGAVRELVCLEAERPHCGGCPHLVSCAFPRLTPEGARHDDGTQDDLAPSPVVLQPVTPTFGSMPHVVERDATVAFDVILLGEAAVRETTLLRAGLVGLARRGIGIDDDGQRPLLVPAGMVERPSTALPPAASWLLRFSSPLRGRVSGADVTPDRFDANLLWSLVVRRARHLVLTFSSSPPPELPVTPPFALRATSLRAETVTRWSDRQGSRNTWRALTGSTVLDVVPGHEALVAQLLSLLVDAGLGKGTSFGFGALDVLALSETKES